MIKFSAYFDSVTLMRVQNGIRGQPGVTEAGVVMGTDANKDILREAGLLTIESEAAGADDLIVAVRAETEEVAERALALAQELLVRAGRLPRRARTGRRRSRRR